MSKRLLVIRYGSLGDVILTSAAITNLRYSLLDYELTYVTKQAWAGMVERFDGVDHVLVLPSAAGPFGQARILREVRSERYDCVLDLHNKPRSWLTSRVSSASQKLTYHKDRRGRLAMARRHHKSLPSPPYLHTIDRYNALVRQLGGEVWCHRPLMSPGPGPVENGPLRELDKTRPWVFLAPGAAHENKRWSLGRFIEVGHILAADHGAAIVWAVQRHDAGRAGSLAGMKPDRFVELVDQPLGCISDAMARARVVIANDSGLAHMSSALGVPCVTVFGPTHPALGFGPRGLHDIAVEVPEPCRPCSLHGEKACYRQSRFCFDRITADMVAQAASPFVDGTLNRQRAILVDRDGTIIVDKDYACEPGGIELIDGSAEALRMAQQTGYKIVVLSNQSGVARGKFGLDAVEKMNRRLGEMLAAEGIIVDAMYYCPHHPDGEVDQYRQQCGCRKPHPGMAEEAARQLGLNLRRSVVFGDKTDDLLLGRVIGARSCLVRTGHGREHEPELVRLRIDAGGVVFDNLFGAMLAILAEDKHGS
ncbi:MAG: HAD-IIIA family hydrolase [bacterium]